MNDQIEKLTRTLAETFRAAASVEFTDAELRQLAAMAEGFSAYALRRLATEGSLQRFASDAAAMRRRNGRFGLLDAARLITARRHMPGLRMHTPSDSN